MRHVASGRTHSHPCHGKHNDPSPSMQHRLCFGGKALNQAGGLASRSIRRRVCPEMSHVKSPRSAAGRRYEDRQSRRIHHYHGGQRSAASASTYFRSGSAALLTCSDRPGFLDLVFLYAGGVVHVLVDRVFRPASTARVSFSGHLERLLRSKPGARIERRHREAPWTRSRSTFGTRCLQFKPLYSKYQPPKSAEAVALLRH
jgi:hypothetical protein